jgi:hypothetical protein
MKYRSGTCRILKAVDVQVKGNDQVDITDAIKPFNHPKTGRLNYTSLPRQTHLIVVGELKEGDYFGIELGKENASISVVSNQQVDIVMIPKEDVFRFATDDTWTQFIKWHDAHKLSDAMNSYEQTVKWSQIKTAIMQASVSSRFVV